MKFRPEFSTKISTEVLAEGSTEERTLEERFAEEINVLDEGADSSGATDSYAAFASADTKAAAAGKNVRIPAGTYLLNSDFKHLDGDQAKASWIGDGPEKTILKFDVTTSSPRLLTAASSMDSATFVQRAEELSVATPVSNLAGLNAQTLLDCTVTLTTAADNTKFAVADWVTVSWGLDIYDADDSLWRRTMMTRITAIDAGTGDITLADPIDTEMNDDGFAPASTKNAAANWADATGYTADDYTYEPGGVPTNSLWQATTTGTSSGTGPADDTGVTWVQRTGGLGARRNNIDARPVIQVIEDPGIGQTFKGFTIWASGATKATMALDARGTYGTKFEDIWVRGNVEIAFNGTEHANHVRYVDCKDMSEATTPTERSVGIYAAQDVLLDGCLFRGLSGGVLEFLALIEANADVTLRNCRAGIEKSGGLGVETTGIRVSHGSLKMLGNDIFGFARPFGQNETIGDIVPERPDLHRLMNLVACRGNRFDIGAKNFRRGWKQQRPNQNVRMWAENDYRIWDTHTSAYSQSATIDFHPTRLVEYIFSFVPLANQAATAITLPAIPEQGIFDIGDIMAVALGMRVKWSSPPASGSVEIRPGATDTVGNRFLFDSNSAVNRQKVTDVTPTAQVFSGNGTESRLIDNTIGEKLEFNYDSNASAAGGTVYVSIVMLIEEGRSGDAEAA